MLAALAASLALAATPEEAAVAAALRSAAAGGPRAAAATAPGGPRAAAATAPLLAAPYLPSALGEGFGPDPDPRFRLDAFDCMTFVETAVALGSASTIDEARRAMDDVRYSGAPARAARNHEVLSQWIPANVAKGWIEDAGARVAGPLVRIAEKTYTADSWEVVRAAGRAIPGLPRKRLPLGRFAVAVVPAADVPTVAQRIPPGAIAFVVRADAPERATRITHAGIVVSGPGGAVLVRHATSSKGVGRVIEEPIERFLRREARAWPAWPVEGLAVFTIRDNVEHLRSLEPSLHASPPGGRASEGAAVGAPRAPRGAPAPRGGGEGSPPPTPARL
ncbi:MAG TPA: N-acetylmuramoyl-L-alanine amidase-like domain-containing protein [Anaeromyxobacter sp.]|nr:N-acetylmuramoyl-L-alanine amidase-like domain-containing protein [Anaeromyxobacter sp.]